MPKMLTMLAALLVVGCASQPEELVEAAKDVHVFYEEPKVDYVSLDRINMTSRVSHAIDAVNRVMNRAAALGADGVIIHSVRSRGTVAGGGDAFGTGGGGGFAVYQIQATAIRYVN